jgi:hypothetical protein
MLLKVRRSLEWVSAREIGWSGTQNQPIGFQGEGD